MKLIAAGLLFLFCVGAHADTIIRLVHPVLGTDYYAIQFSKSDPKLRGTIALNKEGALKVIQQCGSRNLVEGRDYVLDSGHLLDISLPGAGGNWYYNIEKGPACP